MFYVIFLNIKPMTRYWLFTINDIQYEQIFLKRKFKKNTYSDYFCFQFIDYFHVKIFKFKILCNVIAP